MTLKQLGQALGVRDNALSQYETGKRNPQLGLWEEIADYFAVSLDYLLMHSNRRDYYFQSDKQALALLQDLKDGKISYDRMSHMSAVQLSVWAIQHQDLLKSKEHSALESVADGLIRYISSELRVLPEYSKMRKKNSKKRDALIDMIEFDDSVDPDLVIRFIKLSQVKGSKSIGKALDYLESLPDASD